MFRAISGLPQRVVPGPSATTGVQVARRCWTDVEEKIEQRHGGFEGAMELGILRIAFVAHPFHVDPSRGKHGLVKISLGRRSAKIMVGACCAGDRQQSL